MTIARFEGYTPALDETVYVDARALVLGEVTIGAESSVWPMACIRGDVHWITIGARTNIQDHAMLHVTHDGEYQPGGYPLIIGDDVTIGHHVTLHACEIHDRVLVGMGSIILDGAVIRSDVMIGAGSLVPPKKVLESGFLYVGSPVSQKRALTDEELTFLKYSAEHYVRLQHRHQANEE